MGLQKKFKYTSLVVIGAIALSIMGGYFSVYGIGLMFFSKFVEVSIMAIILETLKVITVGMLSLYWESISAKIKTYLTLAVIVLSFVTSLGIYSFLSSSFQESNNKMEVVQKQSEIYQSKKQTFLNGISQIEKDLKLKNERITTLNNLRANQEKRLDDVTSKIKYSTQQNIKSADNQIMSLQKYVDTLNTKSLMLADSVSKYEIKIIDLEKNQSMSNDVGTFKFLSQISGIEMNRIVNWLILLLLLVFDPLAITLIIASSKISKNTKDAVETKSVAEESFKSKLKQELLKEKVEYVPDEKGNFKLQNKDATHQESKDKSILNKFKNIFTKKEKPIVEEVKVVKVDEVFDEKIDLQNNQEIPVEENNKVEDIGGGTAEVLSEKLEEDISEGKGDVSETNAVEKEKTSDFNINQSTVVTDIFTATTSSNEIMPIYVPEEIIKIEEVVENKKEEVATSKVEEIVTSKVKEVVADKAEEVVANKKPLTGENDDIVIEDIVKKQSLYLKLLEIFYSNGEKQNGDEIPNYTTLKKMIDNNIPNVSEKDIKDFLLICNLFKITEFKKNTGYFEKSYKEAIVLVSKI